MRTLSLAVNGRGVQAEVEPRLNLADFLREHQFLTGTHIGCEHGVCGACTVLIDGAPARSCITFAVACDGAEVTTLEGLDDDPVMAIPARGVLRASRPAVRLLHARHADDRARHRRAPAAGRRAAHSPGAVGQSLPLHRLCRHRGGGPERAMAKTSGHAGATPRHGSARLDRIALRAAGFFGAACRKAEQNHRPVAQAMDGRSQRTGLRSSATAWNCGSRFRVPFARARRSGGCSPISIRSRAACRARA